MDNIIFNLTDSYSESFKPELIAYSIFNDQYSYIEIDNIHINNELIDLLLNNSIKYYQTYSNKEKIVHANSKKNSKYLYDSLIFITNLNILKKKEENKEIVLYLNSNQNNIIIYYNANITKYNDLHLFINELYKNGITVINNNNNNYINLVIQDYTSLNIKKFDIKNPKIDFNLSYGDNFKEIDKKIYNGICNNDKGIWLFHGIPGSGKTCYLKNLICRLNKTKKINNVIYMPSEMIGQLESPSFIPFIQDYPDSVLIIEDADIALQSRKTSGLIVKTLLQLTDGILADCLRLKIIATFNCDLEQIDTALLRKGRLQYRHEFKTINRSNAILLAEKLKYDITLFDNDTNKNKTEWVLSDIYNIEQNFSWEKENKKIGFKNAYNSTI